MKLAKVSFKQPVQFEASSREAITQAMAPTLRFEQGFVHFTDRQGEHLVPVTNVKRMTKAKEPETKAAPLKKSPAPKSESLPPALTTQKDD